MTTRRTNPLSTASRLADLDASRNKAALDALRTRLAEAEGLLRDAQYLIHVFDEGGTHVGKSDSDVGLCGDGFCKRARAFLKGSQEVSQ